MMDNNKIESESSEQKIIIEGWGWPAASKKAHYFVKKREYAFGEAICGRWMFGGELEQGNDNSPSNCSMCMKKLKKHRESGKPWVVR